MPFQNVIMPDVTLSEMRGVMALLSLIAAPEAKAAADFLAKLSAEKDAAVEAAKQAAADRLETERLARELSTARAREAGLAERERLLAAAQVELERRTAEFNGRVKTLVTAVSGANVLVEAARQAAP
jgi:hypothetical protein